MTKRAIVYVHDVRPFEAVVLNALEYAGISTLVFSTRDFKFIQPGAPTIPSWARGGGGFEIERWFDRVASSSEENLHISVGFDSAVFLAGLNLSGTLLAIMAPGDLDISSRRKRRLARFRAFSDRVDGLVLVDEWEMSKACHLGSQARHFLWNLGEASRHIAPTLNSGDEVVVFGAHGANILNDCSPVVKEVLDVNTPRIRRVGCGLLTDPNSLFWYSDLTHGVSPLEAIFKRFNGVGKALFMSDDVDSRVAAAVFAHAGVEVFGPSTVGMRLLTRSAPLHFTGSTFSGLLQAFDGYSSNAGREAEPERDYHPGRALGEIVLEASRDELPEYYEDFGDHEVMDIFISVAAIENLANSARSQRVRAMATAMALAAPTLLLSFDYFTLSRRAKLVDYLTRQGVRFRFAYGENSTNPVQDPRSVIKMARLLQGLADRSEFVSTYFVRDVHWLDQELSDGRLNSGIIERGRFELSEMGRSFSALVAPAYESARKYSALAQPFFNLDFAQGELPPGVDFGNVLPAGVLSEIEAGVTFVYTGGVSALYEMDRYLEALSKVLSSQAEVYADFIVRSAEQPLLDSWLEKYGIVDDSRVRVMNGTFNEYTSRTSRNIGILLLDSEYGRSAFAFKAVSYVERAMPYLVYRESPNYRIFSESGMALPVEQDDDLAQRLAELVAEWTPTSVDHAILEEHTWAKRLVSARQLARDAANS